MAQTGVNSIPSFLRTALSWGIVIFSLLIINKSPGVVLHACNPMRVRWVQGQPGLPVVFYKKEKEARGMFSRGVVEYGGKGCLFRSRLRHPFPLTRLD
jgi:hypothetical protein